MRSALAFALLVAAPALADDVPLRPLTYDLDPKLTQAPISNFRELYVDPVTFTQQLAPVAPLAPPQAGPGEAPAAMSSFPPTGTLKITNDRNSWAIVEINGQKVGEIGPYSVSDIGPVRTGQYNVSFTWANGYARTVQVSTGLAPASGAFGGAPSTFPRPVAGDLTTPSSRR